MVGRHHLLHASSLISQVFLQQHHLIVFLSEVTLSPVTESKCVEVLETIFQSHRPFALFRTFLQLLLVEKSYNFSHPLDFKFNIDFIVCMYWKSPAFRRDDWSFVIFLSLASQATEAKALQVGGVLQSSMISKKLKSWILQSHYTQIFIMGIWDFKYVKGPFMKHFYCIPVPLV